MECSFINKTKGFDWKKETSMLEELARRTEEILKVTQSLSVSVIFVRSNKIREINRVYRQKNQATDVISFALQDEPCTYYWQEQQIELGDIFINVDAIKEQAKEYGHSEKRELGFLFVHCLLHCLGYDHMTKKDEKEMIRLQKKILDDVVSR